MLCRASLVLQLTSVVETFMSATNKEADPPTVMQIHQGKLHGLLNAKLQQLLDVLHYDPDLDLAAATGALLETTADLNARLYVYKLYPYTFVKMIGKWFPMMYRHAIT